MPKHFRTAGIYNIRLTHHAPASVPWRLWSPSLVIFSPWICCSLGSCASHIAHMINRTPIEIGAGPKCPCDPIHNWRQVWHLLSPNTLVRVIFSQGKLQFQLQTVTSTLLLPTRTDVHTQQLPSLASRDIRLKLLNERYEVIPASFIELGVLLSMLLSDLSVMLCCCDTTSCDAENQAAGYSSLV